MIYNNSELISALQSDVKLSVPGNISQILGKVGKVFKISKMVDIGVKFNLSDGILFSTIFQRMNINTMLIRAEIRYFLFKRGLK